MCGLAGFINLNRSNFAVNEKLLNCMQAKLSHRGPDGYGIWKSDLHQIGLCHRRLSIVDLSDAGKQPMLDKEKSVAISFNGEIYNHKSIRLELESLGYKYFSDTDTETLIYAYKEWGINFIHKLDGIFAISIFDLRTKDLFLIRDRIGVKPLYYSLQNSVISFASEIKALFCLPWIDKKLDDQAFYNYLTFMVSPAPNTVFDGILKIPAGNYLHIDYKKNIKINEWYNPIKNLDSSENKNLRNENYCLEKIEFLLRDSVRKRMMSDIPVGAFLSGGIDSSLIVALMSQFGSNIKTFTASFDDDLINNESMWAQRVASEFGTDHHQINISEKDAFDFYPKMIYQLDEPLADCVCIPFYFISKAARENGIRVVQVGEGADELFFGYQTYVSYKKLYDFYWNPSKKLIPKQIRKLFYKIFSKIISRKPFYLDVIKNWSDNKDLFWGGALAFNEHQKQILLNNKSDNYKSSYSVIDLLFSDIKSKSKSFDFINRVNYLELKNRLPELLLMRADKMAMAQGVEARVPFLDHSLVEFMLSVPGSLKFKNKQTKYLLKKVAEKYLPKDIVYREKIGFSAPTDKWFNSEGYFNNYFNTLSKKSRNGHFVSGVENIENFYELHESGFAVQKWVIQNFLSHKNIFKY